MVKLCIKKLYKSFKREINIKFVTHYKTTKISFFANAKNKTPTLSQSSGVYKFTCPAGSCNYIGKTEQTLHERTEENAYLSKKSNEQSAIYEHFSTCLYYSHILELFKVINHDIKGTKFNINQIRSNTIVLDKGDIGTNWHLKKHY